MAQNQHENQKGNNQSNQKGQLPQNGPSNQLHEGSQNKDNLNAGSGTADNPDKLSMKEGQSEAKNSAKNSDNKEGSQSDNPANRNGM